MVSTHLAFVLWTGLTAGAAHVLSGPDHLGALAPLAVKDRRGSWTLGLHWGLGHASGVMLVGMASVILRGLVPIDLISSWCERLVGMVLIGIGLWGLRQALTRHLHAHEHTHDGTSHWHLHFHDGVGAHHPEARVPYPRQHRHTHAALAVGALHGFAGGSHFLSVLPALAFPSNWQSLMYLGAYGLGTIVAMAGFSSVVGELARRYALSSARAYCVLLCGCSTVAVGVGGYWLLA